MKNLKIGRKLLVTFGAIGILFAISVGIMFLSLSTVTASYSYQVDTVAPVTNQLNQMRREIQAVAKFMMYAITNEEKRDDYITQAQASLDAMETGLAFLQEKSSISTDVLNGFSTNMSSTTQYKDVIFNSIRSGDTETGLASYFQNYYPVLVKANEYLLQAADYVSQRADTAQDESDAQIANSYILIMLMTIGIMAIIIILGTYITRNLKKPITELETAAREMVSGKLDVSITYQSKDELGSLSDSMREMTSGLREIIGDIGHILSGLSLGDFSTTSNCHDRYQGDYMDILTSIRQLRDHLNSTLRQINESANQVSAGSDQVSSGAQALSQGATEQASAVEQLAATVNEISSQVNANAERAKHGSQLADAAGEKIEEGNRQMQQMIAAMAEISESSSQIGKIIKTIEDIAFQTNILALNAAVEAARAGSAGKGFAVVADEVRNLAGKSAEASKSTAALIEGSILAVERGTKLADETAQTLIDVVGSAKQVVVTVDGISQASAGQAASIAQVTQGIEQISGVVQTNSATAEESAAASEELSGQAQMLKDLVGRFTLLHTDDRSYTSFSDTAQPAAPTQPKLVGNGKY